MYIANLAGHLINPGHEIEITGESNFKFKVKEVFETGFAVEWLSGEEKGKEDFIPYSLFSSLNHEVTITKISNSNAPNEAWLYKRITDNDVN